MHLPSLQPRHMKSCFLAQPRICLWVGWNTLLGPPNIYEKIGPIYSIIYIHMPDSTVEKSDARFNCAFLPDSTVEKSGARMTIGGVCKGKREGLDIEHVGCRLTVEGQIGPLVWITWTLKMEARQQLKGSTSTLGKDNPLPLHL